MNRTYVKDPKTGQWVDICKCNVRNEFGDWKAYDSMEHKVHIRDAEGQWVQVDCVKNECECYEKGGLQGTFENEYRLNSEGGIFVLDVNSLSVKDKFELIYNGVTVATSSMFRFNDSGSSSNFGYPSLGEFDANGTRVNSEAEDYYIGDSKGRVPTRLEEYFTDTGDDICLSEIPLDFNSSETCPTQQRLWFKYTADDYKKVSRSIKVRVVGTGGTEWVYKGFCRREVDNTCYSIRQPLSDTFLVESNQTVFCYELKSVMVNGKEFIDNYNNISFCVNYAFPEFENDYLTNFMDELFHALKGSTKTYPLFADYDYFRKDSEEHAFISIPVGQSVTIEYLELDNPNGNRILGFSTSNVPQNYFYQLNNKVDLGSIECPIRCPIEQYDSEVSYSMETSTSSVSEGGNIIVDVITTGIPEGEVLYYKILGFYVSPNDFNTSVLGSVRIDGDGLAQFNIVVKNDNEEEGPETAMIKLYRNAARTVPVVTKTFFINDTSK